jgi:hypothetical protein
MLSGPKGKSIALGLSFPMYGGGLSNFSSVTLTVKGKVGSGEGGIISCAAAGAAASVVASAKQQ